jgi:hypothetical protein
MDYFKKGGGGEGLRARGTGRGNKWRGGGGTGVKCGKSRSRIHEHTILLRFLGIILRVLRLLGFRIQYLFTLQTRFKPLLLKGGGSKDSKEENS